jgi:hypothetical protein
MKNTIISFIVILSLFGCKKDENPVIIHKLKNCRAEYLYFNDVPLMPYKQSIHKSPMDSSFFGCTYFYSGDKMTRAEGGIITIQNGSNNTTQLFTKAAYDSICYIDNAVHVYKKVRYGNNEIKNDIYNSGIYFLDSHQRLVKFFSKDLYHPEGTDLNYTYSANLIVETDNDGFTRRQFFFENNNLVKVLSEKKDNKGVVFWQLEILFQEFDNKHNPFKNMYFVRGAFFRAFSENNYKSYTKSEYIRSSDGTMYLTDYFWFSMPIQYNADNYPLFGEYEK